MTKDLQVFDFNEHAVRVIMQDGEPWWVAKDVCDVLGLANPRDAISVLDDDERNTVGISDGNRGNPNMNIISESGLYALIMRSNKPEAKKFRKWVTSEVLPTLRKTGRYEIKKSPTPRISRSVMSAMSAAKMILKIANITGNQMTLALDKLYKHYTGESILAAMEIELEAENKQQMLTPTEIGHEIGANAQFVNKLLEELGYQRKISDKWEPTQAGEDYSVMLDTNKRHSDGTPVKQLKWQTEIIDVLSDYLAGNAAD